MEKVLPRPARANENGSDAESRENGGLIEQRGAVCTTPCHAEQRAEPQRHEVGNGAACEMPRVRLRQENAAQKADEAGSKQSENDRKVCTRQDRCADL